MTDKRRKTKTLNLYVNPKYELKLLYLKHTIGITKFVEQCLDKLEVNEEMMEHLQKLQEFAAQEQKEKAAN